MKQVRVPDLDAGPTGVRLRPVTTMARRAIAPLSLIGVGRWRVLAQRRGARRVDHAGLREHVTRLLGRGTEEELAKVRDRRALLLEQVGHVAQGLDRRCQRRVVLVGKGCTPQKLNPIENQRD
jgi:hypothetical protein